MLLHNLAMQGEIETVAFHLGADPEPDRHLDQEQDNRGDNDVVCNDDANADQLVDDLARVAFDQAGVPPY